MTIQTTYTQARASLARLLDRVVEDNEIVIISRRGKDDAALVSADELESLLETAHLLRSPENAQRMIRALGRALEGESAPMTLDQLRAELGIGDQET